MSVFVLISFKIGEEYLPSGNDGVGLGGRVVVAKENKHKEELFKKNKKEGRKGYISRTRTFSVQRKDET